MGTTKTAAGRARIDARATQEYTMDDGAAMWTAAGADGSKVVPYEPKESYRYWAIRKVIDPDGTCFFGEEGEEGRV